MRSVFRGALVWVVALALLLLLTTTAVGGERITDPVGDATPDITAVTVSLINEEVIFEVEFAEDYVIADAHLEIAISRPLGAWFCSMYAGAHVIEFPNFDYIADPDDPRPSMQIWRSPGPGWLDTVFLDYAVAGRRVTIRVPQSQLADQPLLGDEGAPMRFAVATYPTTDAGGQSADFVPNRVGESHPCAEVALVPEPPSPASGSTSYRITDVWPTAAIGAVLLLGLVTIFYLRAARRRRVT